ncbi:hypothetical protein [Dongia sp.]|uniref:hypothetical protein n=1 Tax=Dongia sp. TaxID=1977262 RepID=UPI0035B130D2
MGKYETIFQYGDKFELGVDIDTAELMFNHKPIVTRSAIQFVGWQKAAAIITFVSAACGGALAVLQILTWFGIGIPEKPIISPAQLQVGDWRACKEFLGGDAADPKSWKDLGCVDKLPPGFQ